MGLDIEANKKLVEEVLEAYPKKQKKTGKSTIRSTQKKRKPAGPVP